ncbi:hypothetical protein [Lysobacter fragariae]
MGLLRSVRQSRFVAALASLVLGAGVIVVCMALVAYSALSLVAGIPMALARRIRNARRRA